MNAPTSLPTRPVLRINSEYQVAPGTGSDTLHEDAMLLAGIVEDIINTVAHGLCEPSDMAANLKPTANLLFGAHILQRLATGAMEAAYREGRKEAPP